MDYSIDLVNFESRSSQNISDIIFVEARDNIHKEGALFVSI